MNFSVVNGSFENTNLSKLNGNRLETLAVVAMLDASHHNRESNFNSFKGQSGIDFLYNFIENLVIADCARTNSHYELHFHPNANGTNEISNGVFSLKNYLNDVIVPYLYSENCQIPNVLKCISVQNQSQINSCSVIMIEPFSRPPDQKQVDGIF